MPQGASMDLSVLLKVTLINGGKKERKNLSQGHDQANMGTGRVA